MSFQQQHAQRGILLQQLRDLNELRKEGVLEQEEFERQKKAIVKDLSSC